MNWKLILQLSLFGLVMGRDGRLTARGLSSLVRP